MRPETLQHLGTLEVLLEDSLYVSLPCHEDSAIINPYVWDSTLLQSFTPLNLIQKNGWIQQTDLEVAIENWQWSEQTGLAAKGLVGYNDEDDEEGIFLTNETKQTRKQTYQELVEILEAHLQNLNAYTLSYCSDYSLSIIIGQLPNQRWICLAPTVPQETSVFTNDERFCLPWNHDTEVSTVEPSELEAKIAKIIEQFDPIQTYGWYEGGYNHVHDYALVSAVENTYELAIEKTLLKAGLISIYRFEHFKVGEHLFEYSNPYGQELTERCQFLNQYINQVFLEKLLYRICFWDYEHHYLLSNLSSGDRFGITLSSQFTYNP